MGTHIFIQLEGKFRLFLCNQSFFMASAFEKEIQSNILNICCYELKFIYRDLILYAPTTQYTLSIINQFKLINGT